MIEPIEPIKIYYGIISYGDEMLNDNIKVFNLSYRKVCCRAFKDYCASKIVDGGIKLLEMFGLFSFSPDTMDVIRLALFAITLSAYHAADASNTRLPEKNISAVNELRKHIFKNYDKVVIPATNKKPTEIKMNIVFNSVELSYDTSYMTIYAWLKAEWNDERLTWDADKYDRVDVIKVEHNEIWRPDFMGYNNVGPNSAAMYGHTKALVNSAGNVVWIPPVQYRIHCRLDLTHWPYDTHTGFLKIGSWVYNDNDLNLTNTTHEIIVFSPDPEWRILHVSSEKISEKYPCCPDETYAHVEYNIIVNREVQRLHPVVLIPALTVASLNLLVFWLLPDDKCKLITSLVDALIAIVILLVLYSKIPLILSSVPLIVVYYLYSLGLIVLTAIISVMVKNITTTPEPLSKPVKVFVQSRFVKLLGMTDVKDNELASTDNQTQCEDKEKHLQIIELNKKQLLSKIIDKICFIVFLFIYVILLFRLVL